MASDEKQTAVYKVVREAAMKHRRVTVSEVAERTGIRPSQTSRRRLATRAGATSLPSWSTTSQKTELRAVPWESASL